MEEKVVEGLVEMEGGRVAGQGGSMAAFGCCRLLETKKKKKKK